MEKDMNQVIKCSRCKIKIADNMGSTVTITRNGKAYVWCKSCKKKVELIVEIE